MSDDLGPKKDFSNLGLPEPPSIFEKKRPNSDESFTNALFLLTYFQSHLNTLILSYTSGMISQKTFLELLNSIKSQVIAIIDQKQYHNLNFTSINQLYQNFKQLLDTFSTYVEKAELPQNAAKAEITTIKAEIPPMEEEEPKTIGIFRKKRRASDYWNLISNANKLLDSYVNIADLSIPTFWELALEQLHKYETDDETTMKITLKIPSDALYQIIYKLLKEAPAARLLQRIKYLYNEDKPQPEKLTSFLPEDQNVSRLIAEHVEKYLQTMSDFINGSLNLKEIQQMSNEALRHFSLGPPDIEGRIPLIGLNVAREIEKKANETFLSQLEKKATTDITLENKMPSITELEVVAQYLTCFLISNLNEVLLSHPKVIEVLRDLK